ncbi:CdaR family protein [Fusibacter tunisiensis]|uniref:YbbR domain-containing protein n=1 Tax=Fusibacter tunisiensis TaxID=1008308 RepID=A0ABS2MU72_9FIRM|nr:CdaR family protein [Fusibacter tunisiensis]MBM7562817.1 YbbR domain-containing protein [Fusibacter tunisiensis]
MPKRNKGYFDTLLHSIRSFFIWIWEKPLELMKIRWTQNTGKKILSIILAFLFWLFVIDQVDPEITKVIENVPVQLINIQELDQNNLKIMNQYDYFVNVEVIGRRNSVLGMSASGISLWADMRTVRAGNNSIYINRTINAEDVSIKSVFPNDLSINTERIVSIPKPIKIEITDQFADTFYQERLETSPSDIKVTGPESFVASVAYLGASIGVGNLEADLSREVVVTPYDEDGNLVTGVNLESSYANVFLKLGQLKEVPIEVDVTGEPSEGYEIVSIRTIPETISVSGHVDTIKSLVEVNADSVILSGDETETLIIEKDLVFPNDILPQSHIGPIQVEVIIEEIQTKEFTFDTKEMPVIVGLNFDYSYEILEADAPIIVRVEDIKSIIESLEKDDLQLDLNLSNVDKVGIYRLKINLTSQKQIKKYVIEPANIEVEITEKESKD